MEQLSCLEHMLQSYSLKVVMLATISRKDGYINARSGIQNDEIRLCCQRNNWMYMINKNLTMNMLKDTVHLNDSGENLSVENIITMLSQMLS